MAHYAIRVSCVVRFYLHRHNLQNLRTNPFVEGLEYIQYEGDFERNLIDGYRDFREFSTERYFQLLSLQFMNEREIWESLKEKGFYFFRNLFRAIKEQGIRCS